METDEPQAAAPKEGARKRAAAKKKTSATVSEISESEEEIDLDDDDDDSDVEIVVAPKTAAKKGRKPAAAKKKTLATVSESEEEIGLDDDDDDADAEIAVAAKAAAKKGRKPATAAAKAPKPPAAAKKRGPAGKQSKVLSQKLMTDMLKPADSGISPEKKVRKMRASPFNKKSGSVLGRVGKKDEAVGSEEKSASTSTSENTEESAHFAAARVRPARANRKQTTYVLSDSESDEAVGGSDFDEATDDTDFNEDDD